MKRKGFAWNTRTILTIFALLLGITGIIAWIVVVKEGPLSFIQDLLLKLGVDFGVHTIDTGL
jgi:hypothetical protein